MFFFAWPFKYCYFNNVSLAIIMFIWFSNKLYFCMAFLAVNMGVLTIISCMVVELFIFCMTLLTIIILVMQLDHYYVVLNRPATSN